MNDQLDAIVVEGKKDEKALRKLGFKFKVLKASRFSPSDLEDIETISILTDFDKEGGKLRKNILDRINSRTQVVRRFRKDIGKELGPSGRRDIESINNLLEDQFSPTV